MVVRLTTWHLQHQYKHATQGNLVSMQILIQESGLEPGLLYRSKKLLGGAKAVGSLGPL